MPHAGARPQRTNIGLNSYAPTNASHGRASAKVASGGSDRRGVMEAAPDRRDSYRLPLASGRANVLTTKGQNISMIDVSASGVALLVPSNAIDTLEDDETTVDLGETSFTARLDVVRAAPTATSALRVAGRFRSLRESARQKLSKFLIHGFLEKNRLVRRLSEPSTPSLTWSDPNLIAAILRIHAMRTP